MRTVASAVEPRFREVPLDIELLLLLHSKVMKRKVAYRFGGKAPSLTADSADIAPIDCSGYVRWLIARASYQQSIIRDGSQQQWEDAVLSGLKKSSVNAGRLKDNIVRIAFLDDDDSPIHVGHVVLIYNGATIESYGSHGPGSREWNGQGWQADAHVFVLTRQSL